MSPDQLRLNMFSITTTCQTWKDEHAQYTGMRNLNGKQLGIVRMEMKNGSIIESTKYIDKQHGLKRRFDDK